MRLNSFSNSAGSGDVFNLRKGRHGDAVFFGPGQRNLNRNDHSKSLKSGRKMGHQKKHELNPGPEQWQMAINGGKNVEMPKHKTQ